MTIRISATLSIIEVLPHVQAGVYPTEFKPNDSDSFYNVGGPITSPLRREIGGQTIAFRKWANEVIEQAKAQVREKLTVGGPTDRKQSPDCYAFEKKTTNFELTRSMIDAGWTMWQSTIVGKSKEECAAEGVRYKKFRYPVHIWVSPEGRMVFPKLKLGGKQLPAFAANLKRECGRGIRSIGRWSEQGMTAALKLIDSDWSWETPGDVADFIEYRFYDPDGHGMGCDDEMELHAVLEWLWKAGMTLNEDVSGISLILDFMDYNTDAVIEEWRSEWEAKR